MSLTKVKLFSDGAARGNPEGPAGYGTILQVTDGSGKIHEKELSQGFRKSTNNRMELLGCIAGFEALTRPCEVTVYSDSRYLVDAFNQHWIDSWQKKNWTRGKNEPVKNIDLWKRLLKAMAPHRVEFCWVKGHAGHTENERCDALATDAADHRAFEEDKVDNEKRRRIAARVALQEGVQGENSLKVGYGYRDFKKKFEDTDRIIALLREREKTEKREADSERFASEELRYWETQLNALCQVLPYVLSDQEAAAFLKDQQEWRKKRGTGENRTVLSAKEQAENTRARAYALLEQYKERLR